ncbi:MAG TPA: sulfurtransferase [Candidatus Binatia bacterium]|jgi:thiosulfate/3-mercaptopyruvate sulfurtransferase
MEKKKYTRPELLTTPEELKQKLSRPNLRVIDTRQAELFAQGHIPGAIHFDLFGISLIDTSAAPLKAFMSMIAHLFELRGVNLDTEVVFYEENSGMKAARGLWFLEYFGHRDVAVLDGGIQAWKKAGLPITTEATPPKAGQFAVTEKKEILATYETVLNSLQDPRVCLVDTRSADEYMGRNVRAARAGAIPGAVYLEWTHNLDAEGKYKSETELREMYQKIGVKPYQEVIPYCQGGYRAAHTYLALRLIGFPKVRNYLGSWKEWGDRLDLPIEKPWEKTGGSK